MSDITTTYLPYLERHLTPHRMQHSLNVMQGQVVLAGRLLEAALLMSAWLIEYFPAAGIPTHPNFIRIRDHLSTRLGVVDDFFERE